MTHNQEPPADTDTDTPAEPDTDREHQARILAVREGANGWGVTTIEHRVESHQSTPCAQCPWLRESPVGAFPPEVFQHSANTTYDLATHKFGCHASSHDAPKTCAGFLLRGAAHNVTVRVYGPDVDDVSSDRPLYDNYREMAIANGVDPDDPTIAPCRNNGGEFDHDGATSTLTDQGDIEGR